MEPKIKSTGKTYIEKDRHDIDEFREIVHILCSPMALTSGRRVSSARTARSASPV